MGEEMKGLEASPPNNSAASLPVPLRFSNGSNGATDKKDKELACRSVALKASSVVSDAVMNSNINLTLLYNSRDDYIYISPTFDATVIPMNHKNLISNFT